MELAKIEHELNEVWATLNNTQMIGRVIEIMALNPPEDPELVLPRNTDPYLVRMVLGYVAMKYTFEKLAVAELEEHNQD